MSEQEVRLGGMALPNGVLVHGPTAWGCAIRHPDGRLEVAAEHKRFRVGESTPPLLRGPAKLVEALAVLPAVRKALPEARLAFERPGVLAGMLALAVATEVFAWMVRNPDHPFAKALSRPGHELQHRMGTREPSPEQLEVAEAALRACLELEESGSATLEV